MKKFVVLSQKDGEDGFKTKIVKDSNNRKIFVMGTVYFDGCLAANYDDGIVTIAEARENASGTVICVKSENYDALAKVICDERNITVAGIAVKHNHKGFTLTDKATGVVLSFNKQEFSCFKTAVERGDMTLSGIMAVMKKVA